MRHPSWMIVGVSHNLAFSIAPYDCHQEPIRIAAHAYWDDISRVIELIFDLLRDKHPPSGGFIKVLSSILVCISGYFLVDLRCHLLNSKFITSNSKIINVPICETFITCNAHMHPLHRLAHCLMPTVKSCDSSTMVFSVLYVNPLWDATSKCITPCCFMSTMRLCVWKLIFSTFDAPLYRAFYCMQLLHAWHITTWAITLLHVNREDLCLKTYSSMQRVYYNIRPMGQSTKV